MFELKESADIRAWLQPVVEKCNTVTAAHQYVVERKVVGTVNKAVIRTKKYARSADDKWRTAGSILKVDLFLFRRNS